MQDFTKKIRVRVNYATLVLALIAFGCVWAAGYRMFSVSAMGMATAGAAFLCSQFRTERGVWMGGALLVFLALPQLAFGLLMAIGDPSADVDPMPVIERIDYIIGTAILTLGCLFATYATFVNIRLFPPGSSIESGIETLDARESPR